MIIKSLLSILYICLFSLLTQAQILTHEDSLAAGLQIKGNKATAISGYGEMVYVHDFRDRTATADLRRNILFLGYRFSDKLTFFSEMELEHAKIEGSRPIGEISMEQCFIKFDINRLNYIIAGLFIPRVGIINENHLPTTFYTNDRPITEQMVIPATWREIGIAYYGQTRAIPGLNYNISLMNGLDAQEFSLNNGIREGRGEGSLSQARQKALHGSLLYFYGPWRIQASGIISGSIGMNNYNSGFYGLNTGFFGTTVYLGECNAQYRKNGWMVKALASMVSIPEANRIITAFGNNVSKGILGLYTEIGKDLWYKKYQGAKQLVPFARYEYIDMNRSLPSNAIANPYYTQHHLYTGINWMPHRGVGVKLDFHYIQSGDYNTRLITVPDPFARPYYKIQHFMNLGICYSF